MPALAVEEEGQPWAILVQVQGESEQITLGEISRAAGGGGGGGQCSRGGGGECGNIRNSGLLLLLLAPECGPRKEGTRCQGDNLLPGGCSAFRGFHVKAEFEAALGVVVSRSFLDIFCIKVLILSQCRVSVSRLDMRCFCIKAEF